MKKESAYALALRLKTEADAIEADKLRHTAQVFIHDVDGEVMLTWWGVSQSGLPEGLGHTEALRCQAQGGRSCFGKASCSIEISPKTIGARLRLKGRRRKGTGEVGAFKTVADPVAR